MTLLDVAMAHAARSPAATARTTSGVVTIEMKTSFMRPGRGRLRRHAAGACTARASMAFCEATVFDAEGQLRRPCDRHLQVREAAAAPGGKRIQRIDASD